MGCSCFGALCRQRKHATHTKQTLDGVSSEINIRFFSYIELKLATDNFHLRNKIGRGGFGTVYKGTLKNGIVVAIKVLSEESRQGAGEFFTEIKVITNVKHPNLVELIGCCIEENNHILVYEYLVNGSLDHALLGTDSDAIRLDWRLRSEACLGIARGLAYLHEVLAPSIIHRDIKPSNILLDCNFVAKIGDFGMAKIFPDNTTHVSTRVAGTTGYLAPEYAMKGRLTKKADVYSFGVLVLEIISGKSNFRSSSEIGKPLVEWAWELSERKRLTEFVDPNMKVYLEGQIISYIEVALLCTQAAAERRPSMSQVVEKLSKPIKLNDQEITQPGYMENYGTSFEKLVQTSTLACAQTGRHHSVDENQWKEAKYQNTKKEGEEREREEEKEKEKEKAKYRFGSLMLLFPLFHYFFFTYQLVFFRFSLLFLLLSLYAFLVPLLLLSLTQKTFPRQLSRKIRMVAKIIL